MEIQTETGLKEAIKYLEEGQPAKAQEVTSSLFVHELDCKELSYTNRCCIIWIDSLRRLRDFSDSERGDRLLEEWKEFQHFLPKEKYTYEPALFAVHKGFFTTALKLYSKLLDDKDLSHRAVILQNMGICYKRLGDFENARNCLSEANSIYPNQASVLAQLADCFSLCGEDRNGKVLFREAFFLNPEKIDTDFLDSQLIRCLITTTTEKGYTGKLLNYWIPIFGTLCGIFNIKRELTPQEAARLNRNIYELESEYKDPACNAEILVPRMLNSYFWLIDHYVSRHENVNKINEILLKIKILDSSVYNAFVN